MRILVFTETYLPTINGVVNSIELFRHELEKRGHKVDIVAPHSAAEGFKARRHVFRLPSLPWVAQPHHPVAWPYLSHVQAIVDEVKPDLIHVQGMFATGWLGKRVAVRNRLPHLLTYHTHLESYAHYAGFLAPFVRPLLRSWTRRLANTFDAVITPTQSIAKILRSYGVKSDIVVLPTGIDIKLYHPLHKADLRKRLQFDSHILYILCVARLAEEKNIKQLLIDFGRVHVRKPTVHLIIVGDGPDRRAHETIVEARGLQDHVTFLGSVKHDHLINYFIASDIFAFPSLTDTQGIVLIEAFASGTPCVAYNALGPGDIITHEENGLLAKPGTDQFFHRLMTLVENNALREQLSIGALREVRQYSIEKTVDQLEQLYQVLVRS